MLEDWKNECMKGNFDKSKAKESVRAIFDYLKDDSFVLGLRKVEKNLYLCYIQLKLETG